MSSAGQNRARIVFFAKIVVAGILIGWLVKSGALDFGALRVFSDRPALFALNLGVFFFGACIATLRYQALLRIVDVEVPFGKLFMLQMTAFFFNVVIPGNIGGDVVKALSVARDNPPEKRTTILLLTFVERLLGVAALILVGTLAVSISPRVWSDALLRPMATAVVVLGVMLVVGGVASLALVRVLGAKLDAYTTGPSKISKLLNQLVASLRIVSEGPKHIAIALFLSMLFHVAAIGLFTMLARAILANDMSYFAVASVFPLGLLSMLLPISPAGLGVGHIAFKRLFEQIGVDGGATIFNVYALGQNAPSLLGVFPFLMFKRRKELPTEEEPAK